MVMVEQYEKNNLLVQTSFIAYLRLQVLKAMYAQTKGEKFEVWCKKHRRNIFSLSDKAKCIYKAQFEQELQMKCRED